MQNGSFYKSDESYQNQFNKQPKEMNNINTQQNFNFNQNNANVEQFKAHYQNSKVNQINSTSSKQIFHEVNNQKTEKQNTTITTHQVSQSSNLTNKLTQSIKDCLNEKGNLQDTLTQFDILQKFQEQSTAQKKGQIKGGDKLSEEADYQRLGTEFVDLEDYGDDDNNFNIQKGFQELLDNEYENEPQIYQYNQGNKQQYSYEQKIQQQLKQNQVTNYQQHLYGLQPGDFRIEIENKYHKSNSNNTFKFPRKLDRENRKKNNYETDYNSSNDSSLLSVDEVTVYNLHAQNMKNYQREYMEVQEQTQNQLEKFKLQEQLRIQQQEQEIIEKERLQHQLRQQKMIQQQVYVQHQQQKYSQEKKNEQIQQINYQLQKQQAALQQIQQSDLRTDPQQKIKTEVYTSENSVKPSFHQNSKSYNQQLQIKNIDQPQNQHLQINQLLQKLVNQNINQKQNKQQCSQKKQILKQQQQYILNSDMNQSSSAEKQNNKQQLLKFRDILLNKQKEQYSNQTQGNKKQINHINSRRMKTEGNDIEFEQQYTNNKHQRLHTQNFQIAQNDENEDDDIIHNFEEALQDGSDNDNETIARLDDKKIQSNKQSISPYKNNKSSNNLTGKTQDTSNSKSYKNLMEFLEKNFKTSHSRQSTQGNNSNQLGSTTHNISTNASSYQKKNSFHSSQQQVQIKIQQQAAAAAVATIKPQINSLSKNMISNSRPTTSLHNHSKNQSISQNCSINQTISNRTTVQVPDAHNSSKLRQSSKTSHSHFDRHSISSAVGKSDQFKKGSFSNLNKSIDGTSNSYKKQSIHQSNQNKFVQHQGQTDSRKRSTSNKNNNSINMNNSSLGSNSRLITNSNSQKSNLQQIIKQNIHLNFLQNYKGLKQ